MKEKIIYDEEFEDYEEEDEKSPLPSLEEIINSTYIVEIEFKDGEKRVVGISAKTYLELTSNKLDYPWFIYIMNSVNYRGYIVKYPGGKAKFLYKEANKRAPLFTKIWRDFYDISQKDINHVCTESIKSIRLLNNTLFAFGKEDGAEGVKNNLLKFLHE